MSDTPQQPPKPFYQYLAEVRAFDKPLTLTFDDEPAPLNFGQVELKIIDICPTAQLIRIRERIVTPTREEIYNMKNLDHTILPEKERIRTENQVCPACNGSGEAGAVLCHECNGDGLVAPIKKQEDGRAEG